MDIPRGHAMLPLNEADLLEFIFNYFKAEYSPIRSFWATATAEPRQPQRWVSMGHELTPLTFRPANAQAQKDLEALDYFIRQKNLDAAFVRGLVIRFAKYEVHERLEKKLYESSRLDLMVRKALKEKHLIDALWPSPAPRNIKPELLQQGVKVRQWYGDMFFKYFQHLHSLDDFKLRPEVDAKIKSSGTLMLVPFVDHLVFGTVDPILPIVAKGAGYANSAAWKQKDRGVGRSFGEPDRFEIRFDQPSEIEDTQTRSVVRQCQCLKCGTKRDVTVVITMDPSPGPMAAKGTANANTSSPRRHGTKAGQRYSPGYVMPGNKDAVSGRPVSSPTQAERPATPPSQPQKKQCPRCTFLNHPDLTTCEMCQSELPDTLVTKPPSPEVAKASTSTSKPSHSHSNSLPTTETSAIGKQDLRPSGPNRHSLSSTLFSIFPFSQTHQSEHHAKLPPTQPTMSNSKPAPPQESEQPSSSKPQQKQQQQKAPEIHIDKPDPEPSTPPSQQQSRYHPDREEEALISTPLTQEPEMAMMPLSPDDPDENNPFASLRPSGMPQALADYDPALSPGPKLRGEEEEELEYGGWGDVSARDGGRNKGKGREEESEDGDEEDREGLIDLDAVAREEMGVWGHKEAGDESD